MFKWIVAVGGIVLMLLFGAIVLIDAQADLAQSRAIFAQTQASAFQSAASLAGQCITGLVALLALASGIGLGRGWSKIEAQQKKSGERAWLPGPNAHWQKRSTQVQQTYLPQPQYYAAPGNQQPQVFLISETPGDEDVEDVLFTEGWGL